MKQLRFVYYEDLGKLYSEKYIILALFLGDVYKIKSEFTMRLDFQNKDQ